MRFFARTSASFAPLRLCVKNSLAGDYPRGFRSFQVCKFTSLQVCKFASYRFDGTVPMRLFPHVEVNTDFRFPRTANRRRQIVRSAWCLVPYTGDALSLHGGCDLPTRRVWLSYTGRQDLRLGGTPRPTMARNAPDLDQLQLQWPITNRELTPFICAICLSASLRELFSRGF